PYFDPHTCGSLSHALAAETHHARRRRASIRRRVHDILHEYGASWLAPLPEWARPGAVFRRGFVEQVTAAVEDFSREGERLIRAAPVRALRLVRSNPDFARLPECAHLSRVEALEFDPTFAEQSRQIGLLLHSRQLPSLRSLHCTLNGADSTSL